MATTTNYSWTTPDDTALVKDGASAIRSLGTAIDTTVFNNASAAIAKTIVDAKGDIIAATAADTVSRLAVGANDTVLTADSTAATGLKWASAASGANWSLLNSGGTALTGAQEITISGISGKDKIMILIDGASSANASSVMAIRINGVDPTFATGVKIAGEATYANSNLATTGATSFGKMSGNAGSTVNGFALITGCNTSGTKVFNYGGSGNSSTASGHEAYLGGGYYTTASTVSSVGIRSGTGNLDAGTIYVYASA